MGTGTCNDVVNDLTLIYVFKLLTFSISYLNFDWDVFDDGNADDFLNDFLDL